MIFRLINSSFIPYCILISLGLFYFGFYHLVDKYSYDPLAYEATVHLLAQDIDESIINFEQLILECGAKGYPFRKASEKKYSSISRFYKALLNDESGNKFEKLLSVANYLDEDFEKNYKLDNFVGIDNIDLNVLYRIMMYKYGTPNNGCGVITPFKIHSEYNEEQEVYVSRIVYPIHSGRFKVIYRGHAYQLNEGKLKLPLSKEDFDNGYANIIIMDRVTLEEISRRLELPNYAFEV